MVNLGSTPIDIVLDDAVPDFSATQQERLEQQALKPGGLIAGAYYRGYLGNTSTIGRWNGQHYRFVVWVQDKGAVKLPSPAVIPLQMFSSGICRWWPPSRSACLLC